MASMDRHGSWNPIARVVRPWLVSTSIAFCAAPARAEPDEEAVRLRYEAPPACPDATSFSAQVRERTARGRFARPGELARTFNVELVADGRGFSGIVDFLDDAGASVSRHVHGEQCDAVVSSLALITALALDATLRSQDSEPIASSPRAAVAPVPPEADAPATPTPARQSPRSASDVHRRTLRAARFGAQVGYGNAVSAPRLGFLGQLDFWNDVSLRLTAHFASEELAVDAGRSAQLRRLGLETSLCPWHLKKGTLRVAPCAALDLGSLRAAGVLSEQLTTAREETIWWASVGAQLGLSWEPDAPFWAELRGAAEFPLRAGYRFTFEEPDRTAYQVPYIAAWVAAAVGVRFW
jgi:hypothetical protein